MKKAISGKEHIKLMNKFDKTYQPKPHPMQSRIDEFRKVPSLVTGVKYD